VVATALGMSTLTLIWPASIMYLLIMIGRAAALIVLTATSPIASGGLMAEATRSWFWKTLRWFLACLSITPLAALVLGIGVKVNEGVVSGAGDKTAAAVGMALTGSVLYLVGAICPLLLFRLLAFVDPGTSSGMAMRQSLAAAGGVAGLLGGGSAGAAAAATAGSGAATKHDGQGRSQGESSADSATQSRFGSALSTAGSLALKGATAVPALAGKAASIGSDVLGSAGVGHQQPYYGQGEYGGSGAAPGGTAAGHTRAGADDNDRPPGGDHDVGGVGGGDDNGGHSRVLDGAHPAGGPDADGPTPPPPPPPPPPLRGTRRDGTAGPTQDTTAA